MFAVACWSADPLAASGGHDRARPSTWFHVTVDAVSTIAIVLLAVGLVLQAAGSFAGGRRERALLAARLDALHDKVDAIAGRLDVSFPAEDHEDLVKLIAEGKEIEAIRTYRRRSGAGLVEAKQFVGELGHRPGRDEEGSDPGDERR